MWLAPDGFEGDPPRGVRLDNPGCIRAGSDWDGAYTDPVDGFVRFKDVAFGIRAMFIVLDVYSERHGLVDVSSILHRWSPPHENDTVGYCMIVCGLSGSTIDASWRCGADRTSRSVFRVPLVKAMVQVECARWLPTDDDFLTALALL